MLDSPGFLGLHWIDQRCLALKVEVSRKAEEMVAARDLVLDAEAQNAACCLDRNHHCSLYRNLDLCCTVPCCGVVRPYRLASGAQIFVDPRGGRHNRWDYRAFFYRVALESDQSRLAVVVP